MTRTRTKRRIVTILHDRRQKHQLEFITHDDLSTLLPDVSDDVLELALHDLEDGQIVKLDLMPESIKISKIRLNRKFPQAYSRFMKPASIAIEIMTELCSRHDHALNWEQIKSYFPELPVGLIQETLNYLRLMEYTKEYKNPNGEYKTQLQIPGYLKLQNIQETNPTTHIGDQINLSNVTDTNIAMNSPRTNQNRSQ